MTVSQARRKIMSVELDAADNCQRERTWEPPNRVQGMGLAIVSLNTIAKDIPIAPLAILGITGVSRLRGCGCCYFNGMKCDGCSLMRADADRCPRAICPRLSL